MTLVVITLVSVTAFVLVGVSIFVWVLYVNADE